MKRRIFSFLLIGALCAVLFPQYVLAVETTDNSAEIIALENGDYIVVTTEEYNTRASQTKSANRKYSYTTSSGEVSWVITLYGTFTYNGTTSTCTASSVDVTVNASNWYLVSKAASKSGNTATADVTMGKKLLGITIAKEDYTLSLTCDKNGNLS